MSSGRKKILEGATTSPTTLWLVSFFILPLCFVLITAFKPSDPYGGTAPGWTLSTLERLSNPAYSAIILRTLKVSVATTVLCLVIALPAALFFARVRPSWRSAVLLLIIIPFWTNMLIRIHAWRAILGRNGFISQLLSIMHITQPDTTLLYNINAVVFIQVSLFLPFAILPIYAAAEKFDWNLIEASYDLGAGRLRSFITIFIPGISAGILTAVLLVFIPALGSYIVPDLTGGPTTEMIGTKIAQRVLVDRNLPEASALSGVLLLAMIFPVFVFFMRRFLSARTGAGTEEQE